LTSFQLPSSHPAFGVSMPRNLSRRLDANFQKSATNHGQHRSCVSCLLWLYNVAMPPALLEHCRSTVQWTSCSLTVFVATLTIIMIIIIIITQYSYAMFIATLASELYRTMWSVGFNFVCLYNNNSNTKY